ncbi:hypothetical protein MCG98_03785 [Ruminococcus sp. OA3]|uniref:hypothetical protein n=1 Tax=Ruminococcus sp. OA3 TaxID=2914164 RepID=UPI001F06AD70|nr:hypothetical protein [Ruminococcus sp. OA3]MCH1981690.1 hypothetical protein [Ruminococcus sp. OA3]
MPLTSSISRAVKELYKKEYLMKKDDGTIPLTEQGQRIAQQLYEKHQFFTSSSLGLEKGHMGFPGQKDPEKIFILSRPDTHIIKFFISA